MPNDDESVKHLQDRLIASEYVAVAKELVAGGAVSTTAKLIRSLKDAQYNGVIEKLILAMEVAESFKDGGAQ